MSLSAGRLLPILAFFVAVLASATVAGGQQFNVRVYTENDGLPSSTVADLAQDPSGAMWFLTRAGLVLYDGASWERFVSPARPDGDGAAVLAVSPDGHLWTADRRGHLFSADPTSGEQWRAFPDPNLGEAGQVLDLAVVLAAGSPLVAMAAGADGLWLWHERWQHYGPADGLPTTVYAVEAWGEELFVATEEGLCTYRSARLDCTLAERVELPDRSILALAFQPSDGARTTRTRLWMLGRSWLGYLDDGVFHLAARGFNLEPNAFRPTVLAVSRRGGAFFGTIGGAFMLEAGESTVHRLDRANGLVTEGTTSLLVDREDIVWVGSLRGISKISDRAFVTYRQAHGLLEDEVSTILELEPGRVLMGHNSGLSWFDGESFRTRLFAASGSLHSRILDACVGGQEELWLAAAALGLGRLTENGELTWYGEPEGLVGGVTTVSCHGYPVLWVGTESGLFRRRHDGSFQEQRPAGTAFAGVRRIVGARSALHVATLDDGLVSYQDGCWRQRRHASNLGANAVYAVFDDGGQILVGTAAGLYRIEGDAIVAMDGAGPQLARPVYFLLRDPEHRLWLGTDNGVFRWDGEELQQFTVFHGLAGNETNRAAALVDDRGRIWIGTDQGVTVFRHELEYQDLEPPAVELRFLEAAGERFTLGREVSLGADARTLTFHFRAISFRDEERILFRSRLVGLDAQWLGPVPLPAAGVRYTNLDSGRYRFEVQASNDPGGWSPAAGVTVVIAAPFWQRPWFHLLLAVSVLLGGVALQRHRASRQRATLFDRLTGLPNRGLFLQRLKTTRRRGGAGPLAIFFLDHDRFKNVNDTLGHAAGDELLVATARRIATMVKGRGHAARLGGDEFAIALDGIEDRGAAADAAMTMQSLFSRPFALAGHEFTTTASIGIVLDDGSYRDPEHMLRDAHTAMHRAQLLGSGQNVVFEPPMRDHALEVFTLERELRRAISGGELELHYQPIFEAGSGQPAALEALVRWRHPERGLIPPQQFIPVAEESQLIVDLGRWVLEEACRQLESWRRHHDTASVLRVHVNLASDQFLHNMPDLVADCLQRAALPADALGLEITENLIMTDPERVIGTLERLKAMGVELSLDDFGTGRSSLSYLRRFPVRWLKIDRSFVDRMVSSADDQAVVRAVIALGHDLGLEIVAEGLETEAQRQLLSTMGCDFFQGYLLAKPLSAAEISSWLTRLAAPEAVALEPPLC